MSDHPIEAVIGNQIDRIVETVIKELIEIELHVGTPLQATTWTESDATILTQRLLAALTALDISAPTIPQMPPMVTALTAVLASVLAPLLAGTLAPTIMAALANITPPEKSSQQAASSHGSSQ